ncbi:hypothetical protein [Flavobacterium sp.]|uniref:hypothetical protein n=1 Tax=Flavobacterium sp. TaxID=239 RepID=UPI0038FD3052
MTKQDIIVGQKYTNNNFPGAIYLGIGEPPELYRDKEYPTYTNKNLVVIKDPKDCEENLVGHIVVYKQDNQKFWDQFEVLDD